MVRLSKLGQRTAARLSTAIARVEERNRHSASEEGLLQMSDLLPSAPAPGGEFLFYQTEDGRTRLQVRVQGETVWLTQAHMAELFQTTIPNVSMHLRNVFAEGELQAAATVKEFLIVRHE